MGDYLRRMKAKIRPQAAIPVTTHKIALIFLKPQAERLAMSLPQ